MRYSIPTRVFLCSFGCRFIQSTVAVEPPNTVVEPLDACRDFAIGQHSALAWTLEDCIEVWTEFTDTIPRGQQKRLRFVDIWKDTATELRRAGRPCLAASKPTPDGVGSSTIRLLASWIFAEEMGCDWVTPEWGKVHFDGGNGTVIMYCHPAGTTQEMVLTPSSKGREKQRCSVVDWLDYFQFGVPSVRMPEGRIAKRVQIGRYSEEEVELQTLALRENGGLRNQPWDHVLFEYQGIFASENLCTVGNWDEPKRETTRKVLGEARSNFHAHLHPPPRFQGNSNCGYSTNRLNFALHVRMGDRRELQATHSEYFRLLELFMDTVSTEVVGMGLEPPLFHVFSETLIPCPSADTGRFDEFPAWPLMLAQLPECLEAQIPEDCPEKRAGRFCTPKRPGIFEVLGKPIFLHVGHDVKNALSCMIEADGLLMGCSTFGQIAGLLTKGISFFSMRCSGNKSPAQYKTVPPLAVAERGHMWVPVAGSWRDPVLASTGPLRHALGILLGNKDSS